ncbi:LysE family transporter [Nocardia puris]|uniref:LysE family translocator n=1 Tax=Nocardia puris TaxID=208602 RepID=UPI001896319C|nr:LysE family transporter [Nocardia puris]MBF6214420.1 LysE family transporter [Nocardia puris]MBF6369035.1 LysE family transporter [Nocardia puris]MBF6462817.1 LysE family transporter [Nocardia puris]
MTAEPAPRRTATRAAGFRQGLFSNLLNPKVAAFYLSLFPQFDLHPLTGLAQHAVLAATFRVLALAWYCAVVALLGKAEELLRRNTVRRRISALSGVALVGLGGALLAKG